MGIRYKFNDTVFDVLNSESEYWLGFLTADGNIYQKKNYPNIYRIAINLQTRDESHLEAFKKFLGSTHPIKRFMKDKYSISSFAFWSKKIANILISYGIVPRKSYLPIKVSPVLANSRDFWRGVLDGDGSIGIYDKGPVFSLVGQSSLLGQFLAFAKLIVPKCKVHISKRENPSVLGYSARNAQAVLAVLYQENEVSLPRKREKALQCINFKFNGHVRGEKVHTHKLKETDVIAIRDRLLTTPISKLANEYNVTSSNIRSIANGESWAYLI